MTAKQKESITEIEKEKRERETSDSFNLKTFFSSFSQTLGSKKTFAEKLYYQKRKNFFQKKKLSFFENCFVSIPTVCALVATAQAKTTAPSKKC